MIEFTNALFSAALPASWVVREHQAGSGLFLANSEPRVSVILRGEWLSQETLEARLDGIVTGYKNRINAERVPLTTLSPQHQQTPAQKMEPA